MTSDLKEVKQLKPGASLWVKRREEHSFFSLRFGDRTSGKLRRFLELCETLKCRLKKARVSSGHLIFCRLLEGQMFLQKAGLRKTTPDVRIWINILFSFVSPPGEAGLKMEEKHAELCLSCVLVEVEKSSFVLPPPEPVPLGTLQGCRS